jgi:hypothetical protein
MAITTLAGIVAGLQPSVRWSKASGSMPLSMAHYGLYSQNGYPLTFGASAAGVGGETLVAPETGQLLFHNPPSGNAYLAKFRSTGGLLSGMGLPAPMILADLLWWNNGLDITSTSAQTVDSVAWPARDDDASTDGRGVYIMLESTSVMGAVAPTFTLGYTNSTGTSGRTAATNRPGFSSQGGRVIIMFGLQAGDVGVRSIQTYQQDFSWLTGSIRLIAFRPIAIVSGDAMNNPVLPGGDAVTLCAPQIHPDSVLALIAYSTGVSYTHFGGEVQFAYG